MTALEYAFLPLMIGNAEMFRTSVDPRCVYLTDRFVDRVKKLKLEGTDFVPLWSSEGPLPKGKSKQYTDVLNGFCGGHSQMAPTKRVAPGELIPTDETTRVVPRQTHWGLLVGW